MKKLLRFALVALAIKAIVAAVAKRRAHVVQPAGGPFEPAPAPRTERAGSSAVDKAEPAARAEPVDETAPGAPAEPLDEAEPAARAEPAAQAKPVDETAPGDQSEPAGDPDDLTRITGVGPVYAERLNNLGVTNYVGLAAADAGRLAENLQLPDRAIEDWKSQAEQLLG